MNYKLYFDALLCDKWCCNFIKACDLGIEGYGVPVKISFITTDEPTDKFIKKVIEILEKAKEEKSMNSYYENIKLNRIELIENSKKERKE